MTRLLGLKPTGNISNSIALPNPHPWLDLAFAKNDHALAA